MPLDIINTDNVADDATLNLQGANKTATAEIGGTTYLFIAGFEDNGVSVFALGADGVLTNVANVGDDALLNLQGAYSLATATIGGAIYLFVAGFLDNGVSVFEVGADGALAHVDNADDDSTVQLFGASDVTTAAVGGVTYLFVAGAGDNGVSVFAVDADGFLTNVDNVTDNATLAIRTPYGLTTAEVAGATYLFVAGLGDDGVSVFAVGNDGALTNVQNVFDDPTLELDNASSVTTAVVGGITYLFVAGSSDDGISVFEVADNGTLFSVDTVTDDATLNLDNVTGLTTATVGGVTYLFATSQNDNGVSVFAVGNDGVLTNVANIADDGVLNLGNSVGVTVAVVAGLPFLLVTGYFDNGVSAFALSSDDILVGTGAADALDGSAGADLIIGLGSDDVLEGNTGNDTLLGGDGDDVLAGGAGDDDIHGDAGIDTAIFSGARVDYRVTDLGQGRFEVTDLRPGAPDGADTLHNVEILRFADGTLDLRPPSDIPHVETRSVEAGSTEARLGLTGAAHPGAAHSYSVEDLPAQGIVFLAGVALQVGQVLTDAEFRVLTYSSPDTARDETLLFSVSDGTTVRPLTVKLAVTAPVNGLITGSSGDDRLDGAGGNDTIKGKAGGDMLIGGSGSDALFGQAGQDVLWGGNDNDRLHGGGGKDELFGQAANDRLKGGGGADRLVGEGGADMLFGGGGADTFVFREIGDSTVAGGGRDTIADFSVRDGDRIDLAAIDAVAGTAPDDAFVFIGRDRFSHEAGELRYGRRSGDTFVYGDTDGDGRADFAIKVEGVIDLAKDDFIL